MDFQTPEIVANYMASFMPDNCGTMEMRKGFKGKTAFEYFQW